MSASWETKWGPRRVRHDPPTVVEAISAAQGLTDDLQGQIEIAAQLMGVSRDVVKAEMLKFMPDRRPTRIAEVATRDRGTRTFVVERKSSRRVLARESAGRPSA